MFCQNSSWITGLIIYGEGRTQIPLSSPATIGPLARIQDRQGQYWSEADLRGGVGGASPPFFLESLVVFFWNYFEEQRTVLFEVELIMNNAPLTYVTKMLSKHVKHPIICCLADSYYILLTKHLLILYTASVIILGIGGDMNTVVNLRET